MLHKASVGNIDFGIGFTSLLATLEILQLFLATSTWYVLNMKDLGLFFVKKLMRCLTSLLITQELVDLPIGGRIH